MLVVAQLWYPFAVKMSNRVDFDVRSPFRQLLVASAVFFVDPNLVHIVLASKALCDAFRAQTHCVLTWTAKCEVSITTAILQDPTRSMLKTYCQKPSIGKQTRMEMRYK